MDKDKTTNTTPATPNIPNLIEATAELAGAGINILRVEPSDQYDDTYLVTYEYQWRQPHGAYRWSRSVALVVDVTPYTPTDIKVDVFIVQFILALVRNVRDKLEAADMRGEYDYGC